MIGIHQAAILSALALAEAHAQEAPTRDELIAIAAESSERSPSAVEESVSGLIHGGSLERIPEDCRKDWEVARLRMTELGRGDLAKWRSANPVKPEE